MKKLAIVFILIMVPCYIFGGMYDTIEIVRVVDGDTLIASNQFHSETFVVELIGIDAPEIGRKGMPDEPYGQEAKEFLERKILNKKVKARFFKSANSGKFLCEIYLNEKFDMNSIVNILLIKSGYAKAHSGFQSKEFNCKLYRKAEAEAKKDKIGIWR